MFYLSLVLLLLTLPITFAQTYAEPHEDVATGDTGHCRNPIIRKEWRSLSVPERQRFIRAVQCLQERHGRYTNVYGQIPHLSRYEDFLYVHKTYAPFYHYTGMFLPWHRLFLAEYEKALRNECAWNGGLPYWDMAQDVPDLFGSPIFSSTAGFGGNGVVTAPPPSTNHTGPALVTPRTCVQDGPFRAAAYQIRIGPTNKRIREDRCLERNLVDLIGPIWMTRQREQDLMDMPDYATMSRLLEGGTTFEDMGVHGCSHATVGGTSIDPWVSPAEPLWYLYHCNLDRMWAKWQRGNPNRNFEIGGTIRPWTPILLSEPPETFSDGNVTRKSKLDIGKIGSSRKVEEATHTKSGALCYDFQ